MHAAYALIVGAALIRYGRGTGLRLAGAFYPPFVLFVIVATGNHFFFDAATGALVGAASAALALLLTRPQPQADIVSLVPRPALESPATLERAA